MCVYAGEISIKILVPAGAKLLSIFVFIAVRCVVSQLRLVPAAKVFVSRILMGDAPGPVLLFGDKTQQCNCFHVSRIQYINRAQKLLKNAT